MSTAADDVLAERARQIGAEGWTPEHDDEHAYGELVAAAVCYAENAGSNSFYDVPNKWPWEHAAWKPKGQRHDLVRAAALIIAEIERIDRSPSSDSAGEKR